MSAPVMPYVVGQWVRGERFYGRTDLLSEILDGPRNCLWVLGTRRIGKTSLLKQLEYLTLQDGGRHFPLFWDFQGAGDEEGLALDFQDALYDAEERLDALGISVEYVVDEDLFASLSRLRRRLRGRHKCLLLLCDEAEELLHLRKENPALLRRLHRAMQSQEGIRSVLASSMRLWALSKVREETSPFLHGFTPPLYIRALDDAAAASLVRQSQMGRELRPALDDGVVDTIRRRCDNHPYLLQLVAKRCLELGDLEEACEQVANDSMVSFFFSVDFEMLSPGEHQVLSILNAEQEASTETIAARLESASGSASGMLQRLENLGFIRRCAARRRFRISNFFFRRWLQSVTAQLPATAALQQRAPEAAGTTLSYDVRFSEVDGRYRLLEEAGRGANGVVYRAVDTLLDSEIALKLLNRGLAPLEGATAAPGPGMERARREILLARDLSHPNIARVYHLGTFHNQVYLTMQWIEGPTLARIIADEAPMNSATALPILAKLASALAAAHSRGVLHRDVKPGNILLGEGREPYLVDFGLARLLDQPGFTAAGVYVGTPYYASPEQAALGPLDERSDVYALGVVLFEMMTGRRPFEADTSSQVLELQRTAPAPDPRELEPSVPEWMARLVLRCLAKDPDRRPPTADALGSELRV